MTDVILTLTNAFTLAFVVTSMFSLGLGLTVRQIVRPLTNIRLVVLALVANFVIVPLVAYVASGVIGLDQGLRIGVILMSAVAGAPLAIKASQIARGNTEFSASLVTLQVSATVIYLPLVLPRLIPGVQIDTVGVALNLVLQILLPLGVGVLMNARYDEEADMARPIMSEIANLSLAALLVLNLGNLNSVLSLIGTGAILTVLLVIATGLVAGYVLGGPGVRNRRTLSLSTGQRNYAAAFVIANGNFMERPEVFLLLLAASLVSMFAVMITAGEMRRRAQAAGEPGAEGISGPAAA